MVCLREAAFWVQGYVGNLESSFGREEVDRTEIVYPSFKEETCRGNTVLEVPSNSQQHRTKPLKERPWRISPTILNVRESKFSCQWDMSGTLIRIQYVIPEAIRCQLP